MDIRYTGRNIEITKQIKSHLEDTVSKLEKFDSRIVESHVILSKEKYLFEAEITMLAKDLRAVGKAESKENIFAAIDAAYPKVEAQLKKFRDKKIKDHHKNEVAPDYQNESETEASEA